MGVFQVYSCTAAGVGGVSEWLRFHGAR